MTASTFHTAQKSPLRFMTCGHVDDGKSTLIGRLLYDGAMVCRDQLDALGATPDFSRLLDGMKAEREQGITIDVAYRYFTSPKRSFIVADTPGHEQYTRNMATGASVSDLAIVLLDARNGLQPQTKRHVIIAHLFGIRHLLVAVNKMDLVDYREDVFEKNKKAFLEFADPYGLDSITFLPVSALNGDNICATSPRLPWFTGETLLAFLENVEERPKPSLGSLCLPVQWVCRPDDSFRGYAGTIESGELFPGQDILLHPSGLAAKVKEIVTFDGPLEKAVASNAIIVTLDREMDVTRGTVISGTESPPEISDQVSAHILWMSKEPMRAGQCYSLRCSTQETTATLTGLQNKLNVGSLEKQTADTLSLNDIGEGTLVFAKPLVVDAFARNPALGRFILCDKRTKDTVAFGCIRSTFYCGKNIHWQETAINHKARERQKGQKACCLWLTGLSGAGKSTLADLLEKRLHASGYHTYLLDGDNVRHGLNRDLGFSDQDRMENIRRVAEVARLMVDAGLIVIVSFISPFHAERRMARDLFAPGTFYELFVDAPLTVCEQRDPKGLYKKARRGEIKDFTGLSSPYETPKNPDLHLHTDQITPEELVDSILKKIAFTD